MKGLTLQNIPHVFFKYTNQLIYVLEHHQYATKRMEVPMSGTAVDAYILNPSMNVMVVYPARNSNRVMAHYDPPIVSFFFVYAI
jgi:hypothetical protein